MTNWPVTTKRERFLTLIAAVATVCAAYVVFIRLNASFLAPQPLPRTEVVVEWRGYGLEGNRMGPSDAPVTIVNFSDFQCPFCKDQVAALKDVRKLFPDEVAVVYRHLPGLTHEFAWSAAIASECAAQAGSFETYHDALYGNPDSLGIKSWTSFAQDSGISDRAGFEMCLEDPAVSTRIDSDIAAAARIGAVVTPTLLVNELKIVGYADANTLAGYVDVALDELGRQR